MTTEQKIATIENEMTCVRRKIKTNCSDCGNCDLVMDDADILGALAGAIAALRRTAEDDKAREEGRLIILPPPAKEGDPKPECFYNDCSGLWCLGYQRSKTDDEPCERCKKCWYCESGDYADDAEEAALGGGEGG